uniref:Fructose-bisphosphate aldolase n=1 Tax=Eufriesea mexicana TaxID=516756 RepID=A0A310SKG7_9HYME
MLRKNASVEAKTDTIGGQEHGVTGSREIASEKDSSNKPMVLHGGSRIPKDEAKKIINLGISTFNVNTVLQVVFAIAIEEYITEGKG